MVFLLFQVTQLEPRQIDTGVHIIREGEEAEEMYFISKGQVEVLNKGSHHFHVLLHTFRHICISIRQIAS